MKEDTAFGQKVVRLMPILGAIGAITLFDGGFTAVKSAGAAITSKLTLGSVVHTAAVGAVGYATVKVLMTPDYQARLEVIADDMYARFIARDNASKATAEVSAS